MYLFMYIHIPSHLLSIKQPGCVVSSTVWWNPWCSEAEESSKQCTRLSFSKSSKTAAVLQSVLQVAKRNCHYGIDLWQGLAL